MNADRNKNSRTEFIQKLSLTAVSLIGLRSLGIKLFSRDSAPHRFPLISETEAGEIIRKMKSPVNRQIKPSPPPQRGESGAYVKQMK